MRCSVYNNMAKPAAARAATPATFLAAALVTWTGPGVVAVGPTGTTVPTDVAGTTTDGGRGETLTIGIVTYPVVATG